MFLSKLFLELEPFEIGDGLEVGIGIFSLVLFALAITAYKNTGIKKILFAAAAFGLFAVQMVVDVLGDFLLFFESFADILIPLITFTILILFFIAIVKKK